MSIILPGTITGASSGSAYPITDINISVDVTSPEGLVISRTVNGYSKSRIFNKSLNPQIFAVKHTLTNADKLLLEQHYVYNRLNSFSFTVPGFSDINNQATYWVKYFATPKFTMLGGTFWDAEVKLIRV
jgi:hypothetical protein